MRTKAMIQTLSFDIPRIFVPLKPEVLEFEIPESANDFELTISHNLAKQGLTILSADRKYWSKIEVVVINLNAYNMIMNGIETSISYEKYGSSGLNSLCAGTIRTRVDEPFCKIKYF